MGEIVHAYTPLNLVELDGNPTGPAGANFVDHVTKTLPGFLIYEPLLKAIDGLIKQLGDNALHIANLIGPSLIPLQMAHWLAFSMQVLYVAFHIHLPCDYKGDGVFAFSIGIFLITLVQRNYAELRTVQHCMIPYLEKHLTFNSIAPFTLFDIAVSPTLWFIFWLTLSNLFLLDMRSDSLFFGIAIKTLQCDGEDMEKMWSQIWGHRILGRMGVPNPGLEIYVKVAFCISLLQFFVPVVSIFRVKACSAEQWRRSCLTFSEGDEYGETGSDHTCSGKIINNEDLFFSLADCDGMRIVQRMYKSILMFRIDEAWHQKRLKRGHLMGVYQFMKRQVEKMIFMWMCEHALQINIQTLFFSLQRAQSRTYTLEQVKVLISLLLSFISAALGIVEAEQNRKIVKQMVKRFTDESLDPSVDESEKQDISSLVNSITWMRRFERAFEVILVFVLLYCACEFGAVFICKEAVGNITGCTHFDE